MLRGGEPPHDSATGGCALSRFALTDIIEELVGHPIPERGENAYFRCPLPTHPERQPSFSINLDKGLWLCHACGEKGGLQKLARLMEQEVNEEDLAVRRALDLARSSGFEEPVDFWEKAVRWRLDRSEPVPAEVRSFCESRGINKPALYQFQVGWEEPRRRICLPYWDDGKVVSLKYRYVDKEGTKENKGSEYGSRAAIFGADAVRGARFAIICEGESDTLATWSYLNRHGLLEGVGVGGLPGTSAGSLDRWELWALDLLWAEKVFIAFDGDESGDKAAANGVKVLGDKAVRLRPPDDYDMASYLVEGGKLSALGLRKSVLQAS